MMVREVAMYLGVAVAQIPIIETMISETEVEIEIEKGIEIVIEIEIEIVTETETVIVTGIGVDTAVPQEIT